jgi:hypothetical protein
MDIFNVIHGKVRGKVPEIGRFGTGSTRERGRSGRGYGIAPVTPPTPPDMPFSAYGGWTSRSASIAISQPSHTRHSLGLGDFIVRPKLSQSKVATAVVTLSRFVCYSWLDQRMVWLHVILRSFALPSFHWASSLLRPLLTSQELSPLGSPRVSADSFLSRRQALQSSV